MDRNQIIGWILIVGIVIGYITFNSSQELQAVQNNEKVTFNQDSTQTKINANQVITASNDSLLSVLGNASTASKDPAVIEYEKEQLRSKYGVFAGSAEKKSEEVILENNKIRLYVNTNGAYISKAVLKEYRAYNDYALDQQNELTIFEGDGNHQLINFNHSNKRQSTKAFKFVPSVNKLVVNEGSESITFTLNTDDGKGRMDYVYTLNADDYLIGFDINMIGLSKTIEGDNNGNLELEWKQKPVSIEKSLYIERQSASVFWHSQKDGYDWLNERGNDEEKAEFATDWISFKQQFFSNILIINKDGLDKPIMKIEYNDDDTTYLKKYSALAPLKFEKSSGNFQFNVSQNIESDSYDINDVGFLYNNNELKHRAELDYFIFKPIGKLRKAHFEFSFNREMLYSPNLFKSNFIEANLRFKVLNLEFLESLVR